MKYISLVTALFMSVALYGQEICQNGIDDDADGLTDMNDPDCLCYNQSSLPPSLIKNASFEEMLDCPTQTGQLELAADWKQATGGTPDYFTCDYKWSAADSAGIIATDGQAYVGALFTPGWKEYIGTCLETPLQQGVPYQMVFDIAMFAVDADGNYCGGGMDNLEPVEVTIYGNKHCAALSQPANLGCPTGDDTQSSTQGDPSWEVIGYASYTPSSDWSKLIVYFTPTINVGAIMIGAPCTLPASYGQNMVCSPYVVYDNVVLNEYSAFFGNLDAPQLQAVKETDCEGDHYALQVETPDGAALVWKGPEGELSSEQSLSFVANGETGLYSCYYIWGNCTSEVANINPFVDFSSAVALFEEPINELPNIITPNGDGVNDVLDGEAIVAACNSVDFELSIVDRWGGLVYRQVAGQAPFNGTNQLGAKVNPGVYFYTLIQNGRERKSTLTIVY